MRNFRARESRPKAPVGKTKLARFGGAAFEALTPAMCAKSFTIRSKIVFNHPRT
jgi:hypothetical protein